MNRIFAICLTGIMAFGCLPAEDETPVEEAYLDALSLKDVRPDCEEIVADTNGNLVPNEAVRLCMDHYLSASGEASARQIRLAYRYRMFRWLPWSAYREAMELFDRYVQFRKEGQHIHGTPDAPGPWLEEIRALRTSLFSPEWDRALFGADDAAQDSLRTLQSNGDLTVDPITHALIERSQDILQARKTVAEMRAAGKTNSEIYTYRTERLGNDAATRLAELDRTRADFEARYRSYRSALGEENLSRSEVETLLLHRFTELERRRVRAWDRLPHGI